MTMEKKDPNAWIDKERQKIQDEVIRPMREQLEDQIKAIYLQAAKRYEALKSSKNSHEFVDRYNAPIVDEWGHNYPRMRFESLCGGEAQHLAEVLGAHIKRDYDVYWSTFVDMITADEVREEREEREWYHRLHDWD